MFFIKFFRVVVLFFCFIQCIYSESSFETNRKSYLIGDKIFFKVNLDTSAHIYILNESVTGTIHLVFPNPLDKVNFFQKGNYKIPSTQAKYEFSADEDIGTERFYLIISQKEIKKLHNRNFRENESLHGPQWLRRLTSELLPFEWKVLEKEIIVKGK